MGKFRLVPLFCTLLAALVLLKNISPDVNAYGDEQRQPATQTTFQQLALSSKPSGNQFFTPPILVTIIYDGQKSTEFTYYRDSKSILGQKGVSLGELDFINTDNGRPIMNGDILEIVRVKKENFTKETKITFVSETVENPEVEAGAEKVLQAGVNGKVTERWERIYNNGAVISELMIDSVTTEATKEIVEVGTKVMPKNLSEILGIPDIGDFKYCKVLEVKLTAYDPSCPGCNNRTATGRLLEKGIVAVDPKVIPLHTKMYIPGYGFGQAEDVGGAVKGNIVDVGFASREERLANWPGTHRGVVYIGCP